MAISTVNFTIPVTKTQDQRMQRLSPQAHLKNAPGAHRERGYRELLMASWCAI